MVRPTKLQGGLAQATEDNRFKQALLTTLVERLWGPPGRICSLFVRQWT
jgi:hypothetical protein